MSIPAFKFLQSNDWALDVALLGDVEIPPHLEEALVMAPRLAVERTVSVALEEGVDFVVLCGDLLNSRRALPGEPEFLAEQLARLADRRVGIYWVPSNLERGPSADLSQFAKELKLVQFSGDRPREEVVTRGKTEICRIIAKRGPWRDSQLSRLRRTNGQLFTVGVMSSLPDVKAKPPDGIDYWVVGGSLRRNQRSHSWKAKTAGSPQGRGPRETGVHGCMVATVSDQAAVSTRLVPTDLIRWCRETLEVTSATIKETLLDRMRQKIGLLRQANSDRILMVAWKLRGSPSTIEFVEKQGLPAKTLEALRSVFGEATPAVWSLSCTCSPQAEPSEERAPDGSFLASLHHHLDQCALGDDAWPERPDLRESDPQVPPFPWRPPSMSSRRRVVARAKNLGESLLSYATEEPT